jgi:Neocarzinostatin family
MRWPCRDIRRSPRVASLIVLAQTIGAGYPASEKEIRAMDRETLRARRRTAGLLLGLAIGMLSTLVGPAALAKSQGPGRHGTEFVDVVPSDHLAGETTVKVSGMGYPPDTSIAITECLLVSSDQGDCDLSSLKLGVTTRANGSFGPVPFRVHPTIHVGNRTGAVQCGTTKCSVGVGTLDAAYGGSHCLGFGGTCKAAPPAPSPSPTAGSPTPTLAASRSAVAAKGSSGGGSTGLVIAIVVAVIVIVGLVSIGLIRRRSAAG